MKSPFSTCRPTKMSCQQLSTCQIGHTGWQLFTTTTTKTDSERSKGTFVRKFHDSEVICRSRTLVLYSGWLSKPLSSAIIPRNFADGTLPFPVSHCRGRPLVLRRPPGFGLGLGRHLLQPQFLSYTSCCCRRGPR